MAYLFFFLLPSLYMKVLFSNLVFLQQRYLNVNVEVRSIGTGVSTGVTISVSFSVAMRYRGVCFHTRKYHSLPSIYFWISKNIFTYLDIFFF